MATRSNEPTADPSLRDLIRPTYLEAQPAQVATDAKQPVALVIDRVNR